MIRSLHFLLSISAITSIATCSQSADKGSGSSSGPAASGRADFADQGAGACGKYLTDDVVNKILGAAADERKVLSKQGCSVRSTKTGGELTITLKDITPQSFHAFREFLSSPENLPGVGDSAMSSIAPTVTAIKGNMGCDFDAMKGSSPTALSDAERAKALGELCNKIFAGAP
jgi:hypothetical protein